jgi:hypothetical protein
MLQDRELYGLDDTEEQLAGSLAALDHEVNREACQWYSFFFFTVATCHCTVASTCQRNANGTSDPHTPPSTISCNTLVLARWPCFSV